MDDDVIISDDVDDDFYKRRVDVPVDDLVESLRGRRTLMSYQPYRGYTSTLICAEHEDVEFLVPVDLVAVPPEPPRDLSFDDFFSGSQDDRPAPTATAISIRRVPMENETGRDFEAERQACLAYLTRLAVKSYNARLADE